MERAPTIDPLVDASAIRAPELRTSVGRAWIVEAASGIPLPLRDAAFGGHCKDFRYYQLLEESLGEQFTYRYFVLQEESSLAWAVQPFFFVEQDMLGGLPQTLRSFANGIRKKWRQ